jgi:hypothetical protein
MKSSKLFSSLVVVALASACVSVGCSSNASSTDTVRKIRSGLCTRWSQCYSDSFAQTYPSGQSQCVDEAMKHLTDAQKNSVSPCSDAEVDACKSDIDKAACDAVTTGDTSKLPSSCQKC